jgi:carbonic anhydrase
VLDDVAVIRNHPLVPKTIPVRGHIFDVKSGKTVKEMDGAKALGATGK